jgi:hypothetical protein
MNATIDLLMGIVKVSKTQILEYVHTHPYDPSCILTSNTVWSDGYFNLKLFLLNVLCLSVLALPWSSFLPSSGGIYDFRTKDVFLIQSASGNVFFIALVYIASETA